MKKYYLLMLTGVLFVSSINAQLGERSWIFEAGANTTDVRVFSTNLGDIFEDYFNAEEFGGNLGIKLAAEKFIDYNTSIQLVASINSLGTIEEVNDINATFLALDVNAKFYFDEMLNTADWFSVYVLGGLGFQSINSSQSVMFISGIGSNFWFRDSNFGISVQTSYKHNFKNLGNDVFQHSIGLIYSIENRRTRWN